MASYQKMTIVGNLGNDPELRYMPDGRPVANFSIAVNRKWTNKDGSAGEETTWFKVSVFGNQAEPVAQYLRKGREALVEGRMRPDPSTGNPRIWSRQDGSAAASYEITASQVVFLGSRADAAQDGPAQQAEVDSEGIPF